MISFDRGVHGAYLELIGGLDSGTSSSWMDLIMLIELIDGLHNDISTFDRQKLKCQLSMQEAYLELAKAADFGEEVCPTGLPRT